MTGSYVVIIYFCAEFGNDRSVAHIHGPYETHKEAETRYYELQKLYGYGYELEVDELMP